MWQSGAAGQDATATAHRPLDGRLAPAGYAGRMTGTVLLVEDDRGFSDLLSEELGSSGWEVEGSSTAAEALETLARRPIDVLLTDINLGGMSGIELCERALGSVPDLPVILMTGGPSLEVAVAAIRAGAYDFVTKPFEVTLLVLVLERARRHRHLNEEVHRLRRALEISEGFDELLGRSTAMLRLFRTLDQVACSDASLLVRGETGTGKELVARAVHRRSRRSAGPFVPINCAAIPEALLESELFGHTRGAFTGAVERRVGLLERASGGTLFLDEIGDMSPALQGKLLRALQERRARPVGGAEERPFDVRVVSATHRDLESAIDEGSFRQDLFFRLNVIGVEVPPLRERGEDVLFLAQHFLERSASSARKAVTGITPGAAEKLLAWTWPGNVRELQNCIERAVALTRSDHLVIDDLPEPMRAYRPSQVVIVADDPSQLVTMDEVERRYIARVLQACGGNKTLAARLLGFDRKTLYRKLQRHRLPGA